MKKADVIVIGGSAAGITAAITCRRHYPEKSVLLIRKEKQVLIPCGIPYIFGTVGSADKDLIPDAVLEKNGIELVIGEVTGIERNDRFVATANGEKIGYERLVLATGSIPIIPQIPGVHMKNIFAVKKDVSHLQQMLDQLDRTSNLVIVGGGFIGAEFADECRKNREIKITMVEMLPHCLMLTFDEDLCSLAEGIERGHGIKILAPEKVEAFLGNAVVKGVKLASGMELEADMVILGIGSVANTKLAEKAGLELGPTKGIQVNRYMQTSDENIFACGDCAEKVSFFDGKPSKLKLASTATREARIAGANLFGVRRINDGVIGVFSTILDDTAFALAGLSEREARQKGYNVVTGKSEAPNRHPGGMPEVANLKVKLVFERGTGVILGGQVTGAKSGGELINAISACIHEKMTIDDIAAFPMGTHPALTASPIAYQLANAAEMAFKAMQLE
ncbi:MAG: pyridine nucleotide-disulfide oxidoreductase [Candidatus Latescibacterota bacterium]|nr:MAG: pyridine nucleotide-disulfide oxidoreductase [Candidatus Latescibacterota bacterium]RKY72195.1 MAG: pyridine nucleotide-disulfide oxidoreductase [Candidatus Latescibacterota bacterium]